MDTAEAPVVVWWAILAGGVLGGAARCLFAGRIDLPYAAREPVTNQLVLVPGVIGDLVLGPVAALVLAGAGAATYDVQTAFDARGFWGPFIASVPAGLASAHVLRIVTDATVARVEEDLDTHIDLLLAPGDTVAITDEGDPR